LGSIMLDVSDPRAGESAQALESIQDQRVISYFAEALRKLRDSEIDFVPLNEGRIRGTAIAALGTYDDDRAIEALKEAMNSRIDDTRLKVATAFGNSPHRSAIRLLLKMQDDKYWFVRLRVAQGLDKVKTKESLATLQKLLKDEDEHVRDAAKESLKKTTQ
jgi:HEAT repeat protein